MSKRSLVIIAKEGFQDKELAGTRNGLLAAGFEVILGSTEVGPCTGKYGSTEQATVSLQDVNVADYDRIAFIGGPGAHALAESEDAKNIARATVKAEKPLGAICIAPTILAKAGVLKGKKATVWDEGGEQIALLKKEGAEYSGEDVTTDGLIVTANGPEAAERFGRTFGALAVGN